MAIEAIKSFSNKNIPHTNFGRKNTKSENITVEENRLEQKKIPVSKMLPVMMAMTGLTALNSCTDADLKYSEMKKLKEQCFFDMDMDNLYKTDTKTFVLGHEKDSIFKETKDYKYSHLRIKSRENTRIFAEITRKSDGKALKFINVYDKEGKLTSTILKDPETKETFYVNHEKGFFNEVHDKDGNEIPRSKYKYVLPLFLMGLGFYGIKRVAAEAFAPKMTNKDVPLIDPPENKTKE